MSMQVDYQAAFVVGMAERVRQRAAEKKLSQSALADAVDIKRQSMSYYWKGERPYPVEALPRMAGVLSTSVNFLVTGDHEGVEASEMDLVKVEEIDLTYGLGGTFSDVPVDVQVHRFPRAWLESITSTPAASLTIARGRGDSMQPTIQDGDMVMLDRSIRTVREQDSIWALTVGDIAMIKRLRVRGDRVHILSDNDRVPTDEVFHEEINIVGRVIFIGRQV